jgi:hypothetical protein
MAPAGRAVLPDLSPSSFVVAPDILAALDAAPPARALFDACPSLYQRVRASYVEEQRKTAPELRKRLEHLVKQSAAKKMFGNWDDSGLRRSV